MRELRVLSPTGALGHTPIEEESYRRGLKREPHFVGADAGSGDIGPYFLATDTRYAAAEWEEFDLDLLLTTTRERGIPLIVGSADGCGSNRAVEQLVETVKAVAARRRLEPFRLAVIHAEVDLDYLARRVKREEIPPLGAPAPLRLEDLEQSSHVVAMMGVEPYIQAIRAGADVIIAGRSTDDAVFAALPIHLGYPKGLAYHLGKVLECASMAATPLMLHETMLGVLYDDRVEFEPMHPDQRCTPESVAGHSLYERANPLREPLPGGILDLTGSEYFPVNKKRAGLRKSRFEAVTPYRVKLEGAGLSGERIFSIVGIRDPGAIAHIDEITAGVRRFVERKYPPADHRYELFFHIYGKDAVMGPLEPEHRVTGHEVAVVIEVVAPGEEKARALAEMAQFRFFAAHFTGQKQTAGGAALLTDRGLAAGPACRWTVDHLLPLEDPLELFPMRIEEVG